LVLRFVTTNDGKWREVSALLAKHGIAVERINAKVLEVQSDDLAEIARISALDAYRSFGGELFVEDAGLFVDALNGFPGPYSSYAYRTIGVRGLLRLMEGVERRAAVFRSAVAYVDREGSVNVFVGEVRGFIATEPRGTWGFGSTPSSSLWDLRGPSPRWTSRRRTGTPTGQGRLGSSSNTCRPGSTQSARSVSLSAIPVT
jgi:XTP/dITP diphosphohydrolase